MRDSRVHGGVLCCANSHQLVMPAAVIACTPAFLIVVAGHVWLLSLIYLAVSYLS